jgi:membrane protein
MAAALSYYTVFSLSPLLIIVVGIFGTIWGNQNVRTELMDEFTRLLGPEGSKFIDIIITNIHLSQGGIIANIISPVILLLGAVGVFLEMKESLNMIWGVEPKPDTGLWGLVKNRIHLLPMVLILGFLFIVSLLMNTVISLIMRKVNFILPEYLNALDIGYNITQFIITAIFFMLIFKYLPDVVISWKSSIRGALVTTVLFTIGKLLIGLYIGNSTFSSTYGAAASVVVLLIWIYYSGIMIFFGAEFMYLYTKLVEKRSINADDDAYVIMKTSDMIKEKHSKEIKNK